MEIISEDKINEIRNSADIVSIISSYIPLKMQGKNYFGVCPFHDDHTPSMSVSKEKQVYKCFVCNKGGNVFSFVKDYENISFIEAVKRVADKVGIPLQYQETKSVSTKFAEDYEIMAYATKIFQNNLNSKMGVEAKNYLNKRSINEDIINEFQIGLSLDERKYLYNVLMKKKYDINKLDELGLINKDGLDGYDRFVNRIMIPLLNLEGKVVGFTGRIYHNEDSAKYINTKETNIYKKGNLIFNYYKAKNYIREEKCAILVEGNMDAIRMYASGVRNVLALMGTVITKEQVSILKKLRVPIILMLDNDNAGEMATLSVGDELVNNNIPVKVVRLKGAKDPDEYIIKYGVEEFKSTIKYSLNYFDYKLEYLKDNRNLNNPEELSEYLKSVLKMLSGADNITREVTIKKLSTDYNISYDVLKNELKDESPKVIKLEIPKVSKNKYKIIADNILYYLMSDSKYLKIYNKRLGYLKGEDERCLVTEIEYYLKNHSKINLADFISYAEGISKIRDLVNNISGSVKIDELSEEEFLGFINIMNNILDKENLAKLKEKINKSTDINEQIENINKQINLRKKMIEKKKEV